jgi:hypothetical protein
VSALINALENALDMELTTSQRGCVQQRISRLKRHHSSIHGRRNLEERMLRGDLHRVRRDYLRVRSGYRVRSRYLLGLAIVLVSPRLFAETITRRRKAGFG